MNLPPDLSVPSSVADVVVIVMACEGGARRLISMRRYNKAMCDVRCAMCDVRCAIIHRNHLCVNPFVKNFVKLFYYRQV